MRDQENKGNEKTYFDGPEIETACLISFLSPIMESQGIEI